MTSNRSEGKTSSEAHAYTPGLKVKRSIMVQKTRRLPIQGKVLVDIGDEVEHNTIVAQASISGDPQIVKASSIMGVDAIDLSRYMLKKEGDEVREGENIAYYSALFGLIKKQVTSPIDGFIESVSEITGQIILRGAPVPINLNAYISGKVVEVMPGEGITIETPAALIQGIFGIGGESHGKIRVAVDSPEDELNEKHIHAEDRDAILVGGSLVTLDALRKASEVGVSCIMVGGVRHTDIIQFTGEEIGVAITGHEDVGLTLIVTEGFGRLTMSQRTFDLLKKFEGQLASVNGATQIRAGVLRPEIIIPHDEGQGQEEVGELTLGMVPGTPVRIIRQPHFGTIGKVSSLPVELQQLKSESYVRVLNVALDDGTIVTVPRANVEIIEI